MADYDITEAFKKIEDDLIASMIRNFDRHRAEEDELGIRWPQWQAEQLRALERYKEANKKRFTTFYSINSQIDAMIRQANKDGSQDQEVSILDAIKRGFRGEKRDPVLQAAFFRLNERKLEALIKATVSDMQAAETAVLRMSEDKYRSVIYNAQMFANTGAGSYTKAVDMATRDFLKAGLNCVQYKNGARHTLSDYADMAIKTASTRAYLQGEGVRRQEWGIATVIVNKRGNPCPKCLPFVGKVFIDDVWSGGSSEDGDYPLMSDAIAAGLYHPRCKDGHVTFFPELDEDPDDQFTRQEIEEIEDQNRKEARQQYVLRQVEMYDRLAQYSLDPENKKRYAQRAAEWEKLSAEKAVDFSAALSAFVNKLRGDEHPSAHKRKMALYAEFTEYIEDKSLDVPFVYDGHRDAILYNPNAPYISRYDMKYVCAHEISHRMDVLEYRSWENEKFLRAIENCSQKVYDNREEIQRWFDLDGKYRDSFALSDIISALSGGSIEVPVGHKRNYWNESPENIPLEIFADISSIDVLNMQEMEEILQELFEAYREVIK